MKNLIQSFVHIHLKIKILTHSQRQKLLIFPLYKLANSEEIPNPMSSAYTFEILNIDALSTRIIRHKYDSTLCG